jgi:double zinc ribbon protein
VFRPAVIASVHDVFNSTAFQVARNITFFVLAVFWLGVAYWVYRDARRRLDDPWLVGTATVLGLVPILGPLVYLLFRPPETLEEQHARRVEVQALEARLVQRPPQCPVCRTAVEPAFIVCPVCTTQLKEPCSSCGSPLDRLWQACPYCATPVAAKGDAVALDLDAALTAEARLNGSRNGNGYARKTRAGRAARKAR